MRKYEHWEAFVVQECFLPDHYKMLRQAFDDLSLLLEMSVHISMDSSCDATTNHPAFRAIVALEEPALPFLLERLSRNGEEGCGWEIMAAEGILDNLKAGINVPNKIRGKCDLLKAFYKDAIQELLSKKSGRLKVYERSEPGRCKCGRKGRWISDGISRFGFYCKTCSDKAMEEA